MKTMTLELNLDFNNWNVLPVINVNTTEKCLGFGLLCFGFYITFLSKTDIQTKEYSNLIERTFIN